MTSSKTAAKTSTLFSAAFAETYETRIDRLVPGYRLAHELTLARLAAGLPDEATILVAGAGTGTEILIQASHRPGWRFIAVEPSPDMLAILKARVAEAGLGDRVEIVEGTVEDADAGLRADACIAHLVSHFIKGDADKLAFFRAIAARLAPGAGLFHLDYLPEGGTFDPAYRAWALLAGQTDSEAATMEKRIRGSWDAAEAERLAELLRTAGFDEPQPFFRALDYHALASYRSPEAE